MSVLLFEELRCLDTETIVECMSVESVLQTCKNSLENYTATTGEVLNIWLEKLLPAYILRSEDCIDILSCLCDWYKFHLKSTLEERTDAAFHNFTESMEKLRDFVLWAQENPITDEHLAQTISFFILGAVFDWLKERCKDRGEDLVTSEVVVLEIYFTWLVVLRYIISMTTYTYPRLSLMVKWLQEISKLLDVNPTQRDILVETNRMITDICVHFVSIEEAARQEVEQKHDKEQQRQDEEELSQDVDELIPDWLRDAIIHLCDTITTHVFKLHAQFNEDRSMVIHKHFKMLQNLFISGVRKLNMKAYDSIHNLLNGGLYKKDNDLIFKKIKQIVHPKLMELYEQIYKLETFQKHLETYLTVPELVDNNHYDICMDFLTVTITADEAVSEKTCHLLEEIFKYLFKDAYYFTAASYYNRIIERFACLLYSVDTSRLFKYFVGVLFQGDIIRSQACSDVLLLSFRLRESERKWSHADIAEAKRFWIKCNNSYAMFSNNLHQGHVQRMLRYFHKLDKNKEMPAFSMANYRYLHCVSVPKEEDSELWKMRIKCILKTPLSDTEQYYELVALLHLVALSGARWLILIADNVQDIMQKDTHNCERLACVFFKLALNLSAPCTLKDILQNFVPAGPLLSGCWYLQKFIDTCRNSVDETISELGGQCTIADNYGLLLDSTKYIITPGVRAEQFDNHLEWKHEHLYSGCQSTICNRKRKLEEEDIEYKSIITKIKDETKKLIRKPREFDESDVLQLNKIITSLENALL